MTDKRIKPEWQNDKEHGSRTFKLTGYTTMNKINRKYQAEGKQRFLRKTLTNLIILIAILILLALINPLKSFVDFKRVVGIKSFYRGHVEEYADTIETDTSNTTDQTDQASDQGEETTQTTLGEEAGD